MDKLAFYIVLLAQTTLAALDLFYHEPSHVLLNPNDVITETMDFGFTMGHQKLEQRLVVGAPHADHGRVYGCHIDRDPKNTVCELLDIDVKKLAKDYDRNDIEQKFRLGATIATMSNSFLTCAPLWTTTGVIRYKEVKSGSYGTCFVYYNDTNVQRIQGLVEQRKNVVNDIVTYKALYGGIGWSSLVDERNGVLLIGKPFENGDIQYINTKDLEQGHGFKSLIVDNKYYDSFNAWGLMQVGYTLAAGRFFNNETMYAFSAKNEKTFLNSILFLHNENMKVGKILIVSKETGDMFGASMHAADLNEDGLTDLLVGAPAHSVLGGCETGALYIYTYKGGKLSSKPKTSIIEKNWRRVVSDKAHSRFGTAIATSDLDGDSVPEIFVSAPYEDFGNGALYILSGDEVMTSTTIDQTLKLKNLKWTQRIQRREFKSFGFSLQVVSNMNENGCDGLAVGSPRSSRVMLLRCIPAVDAILSINTSNKVVKSAATSFIVEVCVGIVYHTKSEIISTKLQVTSTVHGKGATLVNDKFVVDFADKKENLCENVTVTLRPDEIDFYHFTSKLGYLKEDSFNQTDFDSSWVRLSKRSNLQESLTIERACKDDCDPKLEMDILWAGSNTTKEFYVDEKRNETVTLLITNFGASAYKACVSIKVIGTEEHIICQAIDDEDDVITCASPVIRNSTYALSFVVDINKATNVNDAVHIEAELYTDCKLTDAVLREMDVHFIFGMKKVYIPDGSHNVTVTETQIKNGTNSSLVDKHEYKIVNNGGLEWENLTAIIHVPKQTYIQNYSVLINHDGSKCIENDADESVEFLCTGIKLYDNPVVVYLITKIPYKHIKENTLKVESRIEVRSALSNNDSSNFVKKSQTTIIQYVKEDVIGNNKTAVLLIVIFAALIILLLIAAVLYKVGFFKRKELSRLDSLKASVRSKSQSGSDMLPASGVGDAKADSTEDSVEDFDIEVIDDSPFEVVPLTTDDDAALIVENKTEPSTAKIRTKSTSSQSEKREKKRKASSASRTANDKDSSEKQD